MTTQSTTAGGGDESPGRRPRHPRQRSGRRILRRLALALVPALGLLAVRAWLAEPFIVSSDSMEPAIAEGSVVLMYKPAAASGMVRRGVVVAFTSPEDGHVAIKRVVAVAGQSVAIRDSELYVDGMPVDEPFIDHSRIDATYFGPVTVPPGNIFVLGDNRGVSIDSRDYGAVPLTAVQGLLLTAQK